MFLKMEKNEPLKKTNLNLKLAGGLGKNTSWQPAKDIFKKFFKKKCKTTLKN